VRIVNGVVQTGLNVARYADGTTIAEKPLRMRGTVREAIITGGSAVLAVDAESRTFVNVLDVATATVRLQKDVKIKGQLAYAELTPAGLLYVSRSDAATNGEVNVIDLTRGEPKYQDAIEGTKSAALLHAVDGRTLYVFTSRDHKLYSVDRQDGSYRALSPEIKLQGNEDATTLEIRPAGSRSSRRKTSYCSDATGRSSSKPIIRHRSSLVCCGRSTASTPYAPVCTAPRPRRMVTHSPKPHARPRTRWRNASRARSPQPIPRAEHSCRDTRPRRRRWRRSVSRRHSPLRALYSC